MKRWSRFITNSTYVWLVGWPLIGAVVWIGAPRVSTILKDSEAGFLPPSAQSQQAQTLLKSEFPDYAPASRAVVVAARTQGLTTPDHAYLALVASQLEQKTESLNWHVHSSVSAPFLKNLLESSDGGAAMIVVDLSAPMLTHSTVSRVRSIQQVLVQNTPPPGLMVEVTGTAALGELLDANTKGDVDRTTAWAFVAISIIIMLVYRSPLAMLLPVFTIAVSLAVILGLLGRAADMGLPINGLVEMFIIVIVAGTSTDYCLFLFARFREHRAAGCDVRGAVAGSLSGTGGAILASAGTNAAGLGTLALALNRDLYTSGPIIAVAICLATICVLTLTPALMCLVGRWLLWPANSDQFSEKSSKCWEAMALAVIRKPGLITLFLLVLLGPLAWLGARIEPLYDNLDEYPPTSSFVRGAKLYEKHYSHGRDVSEQSVIIQSRSGHTLQHGDTFLAPTVERVVAALRERFDVAYIRHLYDPLAMASGDQRNNDRSTSPMAAAIMSTVARPYFVGKSGRSIRLDVGLLATPRSREALDAVETIRTCAGQALAENSKEDPIKRRAFDVYVAGSPAIYADIRAIRERDFRVIAIVAIALVYLILWLLIRSPIESAILVLATLLTYLATYGASWLVFRSVFGVESLSYQIDFLLFIIVLSLGQDYNIYVVSRIHEEHFRRTYEQSIRVAIASTGRVVSSCGLIMAAAFGSMYDSSMLLMKEFAITLALGILLDTFLIRPLLVPAVLLLLNRRHRDKFCTQMILTE